MFDGTDSFYFSTKGDLTNSLQRKDSIKKKCKESDSEDSSKKPPWANYDER